MSTYSDDEYHRLGPLNQRWPFGGEGHSNDVPVPEGVQCAKINKLLAHADRQGGEYSFGGRADTLPVVPGLVIKGVGPVSVPLGEEQAAKLIAQSKKSPFGQEFETKMDDNVRNSWQLEPGQVEIKNSQWHTGIRMLSATIAERLGYEGVALNCVLYKMLIYGEGGHFVKHQDTEKEDGMIATLVVQLPSLHEGGDLIIYRDGKAMYRHDFGKADGSASYFPHYAVHYADAEHALEKVTKGYRLVLVYSLCLPPKMIYLKKSHDKVHGLAEAISGMVIGEESFALVLTHEYTDKSVGDLGVGALKGIDRARFSALKGANDVVSADKQLQFFIVGLSCTIDYIGEAGGAMSEWEEHERMNYVFWYSERGGFFASEESIGLNFLNPGQETFDRLWRPHGKTSEVGYLGNEGNTKETTYSRYAVTAWPASQGVKIALRLSNSLSVAMKCLQSQAPVDAAMLKEFMDACDTKADEIPRSFFQTLSKLLVDLGDSALAVYFLTKFFHQTELAAALIPIARKFDWEEVGPILSRYLLDASDENTMAMSVDIVDKVGEGAAQSALFKLATDTALKLSGKKLAKLYELPLICKWFICLGDKQTFEKLAAKFTSTDANRLEPVTEAFLKNVDYLDRGGDKCGAFGSVLAVRIEWLNSKQQIQELNKPFSWEMPDAEFQGHPQVQAFLRGPDDSMTTKGVADFEDLQAARNFAAESMRKEQVGASFEMEAAEEGDTAFVNICKTRDLHLGQQTTVAEYSTELKLLVDCYDEVTCGLPKKRARVEGC